jgi:hypothetical protein
MIKFFRKIRQNLLLENKTGKYFKYAIGEILLVVIGILIALQINNWNTERQNENIRNSFLMKIDLELDYNKRRLNNLSEIYDGILEQNIKLYDTLLVKITPENVEDYLKVNNFNASTLNLSSSTFEQMKSTGNLHTLKTDTLLNAIETYYKLCEREDFYLRQINERITSNTLEEINHGLRKAQLDFYANGIDYTLKKNGWLLDSDSDEYAEFIRELLFTNYSIRDILNRIDSIIDSSNNLKELIKKELEFK